MDCNLSKQQTSWSLSAMRMRLSWGIVIIFSKVSCILVLLKVSVHIGYTSDQRLTIIKNDDVSKIK